MKRLLLVLAVVMFGCGDDPTEPVCDENSPDWPECHEQGSGNGGQ